MATITEIKRRIQELAPAQFQEFCDTLLSKHGYGLVHGYGMKAGTGNTTIGNPDTYFRKENGKYVQVAYTIQQSGIYSKLKEDIEKSLEKAKTGLDNQDIEEIICCHTSSNLSAGDDKKLHELTESKGIKLTIFGIDEIANQVLNHYRSMAKDFLGLSIDTCQILSAEDFVARYNTNKMLAPLSTVFKYRDKEKDEISKAIDRNSIIIVTGRAGVGKTKLVLETVKTIASTNGYILLCIKNNNLGIYDDLISATEQPGKYLFFIDDANELAGLSHILEYTIKDNIGYSAKVVMTVRDYVRAEVVKEAIKYSIPYVIKIPAFSDEEIKGFLGDNLEIRNEEYVKQIVRIAEGNPRIAYMAGRLAVEKQNLSAIRDVSQLYDIYYEKYIHSTLGEDKDLCFTAGILSVINAVLLNNMSALQGILKEYGMTSEDFKDNIIQLARMEVVEIQGDQVAYLSDQCFANYMIYYVFCQRKLVPLGEILETGYEYYRNGVVKVVSTILNLFESQKTRAYCKQEILRTWDNLKGRHDTCFRQFVNDFHVFNPEESFLLAQQEINDIQRENIDLSNIDFNNYSVCRNDDILQLFSGYHHSDYIDYVLELLLNYCGKTEANLISGYKWLENNYGIEENSCFYDYFTERRISEYLLNAVSEGSAIAMIIGFQWAKYALDFTFRPTEIDRSHQLIVYTLVLQNSKGVKDYRRNCWKILLNLSAKSGWQESLLSFLYEYAKHLRNNPNREVAEGDVKYVEQLLSALESNRIGYLCVIQDLLNGANQINVKYDERWESKLTGNKWHLFKLLRNDFVSSDLKYEDYVAKRELMITEYGKKLPISSITNLVKYINSILTDSILKKHNEYSINQGLELIIKQFNLERLNVFLSAFIEYGPNILIRPFTVLESLCKSEDLRAVLNMLKGEKFPQKNEWMFGFFEAIPNDKADPEMLDELLNYLKDDSDISVKSSLYRSLRVLDKFLDIVPNVYVIASSIIFEKRKYNPFIVRIYFEKLFHEKVYKPKELLSLFECNVELLQEIFFYLLRNGQLVDYNGVFLAEFLPLDESWLQKYSVVFWEQVKRYHDDDYQRCNALWKTKKHIEYFDYLFDHCPMEEVNSRCFINAFTKLLSHTENDDLITINKQEWLNHVIIDNAITERIGLIFKIICELNDNTRKQAMKTFLECNPSFEAFKKLPLIPTYWSGNNSLISFCQRQIDFLESLYTIVPGIKYLKHKERIKSEVRNLQKCIKEQEVVEIYRSLYM